MRDRVGGGHGPPPKVPSFDGAGLASPSDDWMMTSGGLEVAGKGSWAPDFQNPDWASTENCDAAAPDTLMDEGEHLGCLSHVPGARSKAGCLISASGEERQVGTQDMEDVISLVVHVTGENREHVPTCDGEVPVDSRSSGTGACDFSDGVFHGFSAQTLIHNGHGLHGDLSAQVSMDGGNMQRENDSPSVSHNVCTPGVRQHASPVFVQQNPNVNSSTANLRPWNSHATAWKRPKVVPMPPKKDLGQISLDGTTALLDDGEIDAAMKRLEGALVGRMFGRKIPYPQLSRELKRRWEGFGGFRLITLSNDCFICLFDCAAARDAVLMEGPWVLFGQVLGLDRWSPSFSPSSSDGFLTPVWVRMPELPFFCWTTTNIARIVSLIGEPLWIDSATDRLDRGLFARACVRLDLSKPLQAGLWIEGKLGKFFQPIEYEGLSVFCFRCSQVGHKANSCKLYVSKTVNASCSNVPIPDVVSARPTALDSSRGDLQGHDVSNQALDNVDATSKGDAMPQANLLTEDRGAGPWMLVTRKRKPNKGKANGVLRHSTLKAAAIGRSDLPQDTAGGGRPSKNNPHNIFQNSLDGKTFGSCHLQGANLTERHLDSKALHVQAHAKPVVQHEDIEQPDFGGFKAVANSSVVKVDARRKNVQMDGMGAAVPLVLLPPSSQVLAVDSCATPKPSMHLGEPRSAVPEPDISSSQHAALVLYNQDDRMRCGIKSLKKEKMLNDLGPVSLTPRKRRMIALNNDGGDASPSPPP